MNLLLDFLPILIFFGVYKATGNLITATTVLIPVTELQAAKVRVAERADDELSFSGDSSPGRCQQSLPARFV